MPVIKSFNVFGELVEVHADGNNGTTLSVIAQTCAPGGGPPPHMHLYEDEFFSPISGDFEMFNGETWTPLTATGHFCERSKVHAFRNCGATVGSIRCIATAGSFPEYLEHISTLTLPQDMQKLVDISDGYGISFHVPGVPLPSAPAAEPELAYA